MTVTNRTRVDNHLLAAVPVKRHHVYPNGSSFDETTWAGSPVGYSNTIDDVNNKDFRLRQRKGLLTMSDMVMSKYSRSASTSSFQIGPHTPTNWGTSTYTGDISSLVEAMVPLPDADTSVSQMMSQAMVKVHNNLNSTPLLSGEMLGSLTETIGMLRRPFASASALVERMIRSKARRRRRFPTHSIDQIIGDVYLESRYGWGPLFMDIEAICSKATWLRSKMEGVDLVARAGVVDDLNLSRVYDVPNFLGPTGRFAGTTRRHVFRSANAGIIYRAINQTTSEMLLQSLGLRGIDLSPTAWEMLPLSFVVDHFIRVGDWLRAVQPNPNISVLGKWVTTVLKDTKYYDTCALTHTLSYSGTTRTYTGTAPASVVSQNTIVREVHPDLPNLPVLVGRPPTTLQTIDELFLANGNILSRLEVFKRR